jgi:hypothetical protein
MSKWNSIQLDSNNPVGDAFGRLRTSSPTSLFDAQLTYDLQPLLFEAVTLNTGATVSHDATNRRANMAFSSTPTGGKAFMQSYEYFRYRAGHSQLIYITFAMGAGVANVKKFAGYSDGTNGIELQRDGASTIQFALLSSTTNGNQTVAQANWNLDKLDGTGASGITLDLTDTQILVIDFQALYAGRVRIGFDIAGVVVWAHQFTHANSIANPYIATANLPIRCGMTSTGTVTATMNFICCTVQSENGESSKEGFHFSQDASVTAGNNTLTHLISIQPKTTFNSITNRTKIIIDSIDMIVRGTNSVHFAIVLGDVLTGTTGFNDVNATYSATQYNTAGTTSGTPSITIYTGHIPASGTVKGAISQNIVMKYPITLDVAGNARALGRVTVLVSGLGGTSLVEGAINWTEVR